MESYNEDDSSEEKTKLLIKSIDAPTIVNVSFFSNQLHLINKIELNLHISVVYSTLQSGRYRKEDILNEHNY